MESSSDRGSGPGVADGSSRRRSVLALLLLVPAPTIGTTMAMWVAPGPAGKTVYFLCKLWILALPLIWIRWVERRPAAWSPMRQGGLGAGALSGVAIGVVILVAGLFIAEIDPGPLRSLAGANGFARPAVFLLFAAYLTLINSLLEEYVWRWFVYAHCERLLPRVVAVGAAALFFTLHHFVAVRSYLDLGPAMLAAAGVFTGGVLWSWLYQRYRSIWPGYVSHVLIDAAIFVVGWVLLFERA